MLRGAPPAAGPTGTVGRRGPCAGHAGAAWRFTKRHRRLWALPGPSAVDGPRRLRVDACASRHRRPRDHSWDRGPYAGRRSLSCSTRSGPTRLRMPTLAQPAAGPARGPWVRRGMRAGRRSCVTRNGHVDVEWPARSPRSQDWSHGRRRRDVHASTRSSRGPCTANGPGRAHSRRCRLIVQRRAAPAWSARGPRSQLGPRPAVPRGACGSVPVTRSRRWRSESGFRAVRHGPW